MASVEQAGIGVALAEPLARRSAAIAFLDVVGYSRLMGVDEETTLRRWLSMRRGVIEPSISAARGRVVDRAGDGLLAEFPAALDAVCWAIGVQAALAPVAAEDPPMQVRIAVHRGEVLDSREGTIHGDGVNITARLQAFAEAGGIIATAAVVDDVASRVAPAFRDLGELHLRHIARPVRAYALGPVHALPASAAQPGSGPARGAAQQQRPSIAVLPFRAAPGAEDRYFAEGIIETIVHALSGLEDVFVISHGSTLGYATATVDPRAVGRELGVRYVLHGAVRRAGRRLRITTELNDAESGALLLAGRHEGQPDDLFDLQDRIAEEVVATVAPQVREQELRRAIRKHPDSMTAYDLMLQALDRFHRLEPEAFAEARSLLLQAVSADRAYAPAQSYLALWHVYRIALGWSPDPAADAEEAVRSAAEAMAQDASDALAMAIRGHALSYTRRDLDMAGRLLDRARQVRPGCALAWAFGSLLRGWNGDGRSAVAWAARAMRLAPFDPFAFFYEHVRSQAHYVAGEAEEAIAWGTRSLQSNPRHAPALRTLIASLVAAGRDQAARREAARLLALEPRFALGVFSARTPLGEAVRDGFVQRLRAAGLPD